MINKQHARPRIGDKVQVANSDDPILNGFVGYIIAIESDWMTDTLNITIDIIGIDCVLVGMKARELVRIVELQPRLF